MIQVGRRGRASGRRMRSVALIPALVAVSVITACQSSITQREAPTPVELYGGVVEPVTEAVVLRYRPMGTVQLSATTSVKTEISSYHILESDAVVGTATIESAGESMLHFRANFRVTAHQLDEDLDVQPFPVDLRMTDLGVIREVDWHFAASDRLTEAKQEDIVETMLFLFPILSWPELAIVPGQYFDSANFYASRENVVLRETGEIRLRLDGRTVYDGRPAYLVGFSGRAISTSDNEAISGYYIVDAETGFVLEHRFVGRNKDTFQQYLVYQNYDIEAHLRP